MATNPSDLSAIRQAVIELAPWQIDVEIVAGITSAIGRDAPPSSKAAAAPVVFATPKDGFVKTLHTLYPNGLEYRSFLDCACNCGAYCVWAKEQGAGRTLGIDGRNRMIRQAKLLQLHRQLPLLEFEQLEIEELGRRPMPRFDVTLFKSIFHLLADPISGLTIAANLTREVLIVNSPVIVTIDPEPLNGSLFLVPGVAATASEKARHATWLPSGPKLLQTLLQSLVEHVKLHFHVKPSASG
jgi:hypothetical protein